MIRAALAIVACLAALHLLGARADVAILSGTTPGGELELAAGVAYAIAWFAAVLVAPVLVIAAALSACGKIVTGSRSWTRIRRP